jgi:hypothetical protein
VAYLQATSDQLTPAFTEYEDAAIAADVTIRQTHLDAAGRRLPGQPPAMTFRMERLPGSAGVRTTLTLTGIERVVVGGVAGPRPLDHPFQIARMVHDGHAGLRLYNARGDDVPVASAEDRRWFGRLSEGSLPTVPAVLMRPAFRDLDGWSRHLMASRAESPARRAHFERLHGPAQGSVRGLDRFVSTDGFDLDEVLVEPDTALPVEVNAVRGGALVSRLVLSYGVFDDSRLVRRSVRAERAMPEAGNRRLVTDVSFSNVRLGAGVRP